MMYFVRNIFVISLYSLIIFAVFSKEKSLLYVKNAEHDGYTCEYDDNAASFDNTENGRMCLSACAARRCTRVFYFPDLQLCLGCFSLHISSSLPVFVGYVHYEASFQCPSTHYQFNTSCYTYTDTPMTWNAAKTHCEDLNGYIATINNPNENTYVTSWLFNNSVALNDIIWLGVTDSLAEDSWLTVGGDIGVCGGPEDCVAVEILHVIWNDVPCSESRPVVCEIDLI